MTARSEARHEVLSTFVRDHPRGWHHGDWERLLQDLRTRGLVSPGEEDDIGRALELERVRRTLEGVGVRGLGPKRCAVIADAFPHVHHLHRATADELAGLPSMNRSVAEALVAALR